VLSVPLETLAANFKTVSLREHIGELLTNAILSGDLKPGDRLNESALARQLHVSRAPIREALQQLEEQGLVLNRPRRGMFVVCLQPDELNKITSLRLVLEAEALELARERMTPALIRRLDQIATSMERTRGMKAIEATRLDLEFHRTLWNAGGNEYLEKMLSNLTAPLFAFAVLTMPEGRKMRMILDSHRPLLEFVEGRTARCAREVMYDHISLRYPDAARYASRELRALAARRSAE
jgi:DNA-binding GntR family transcriptional regulator